MKRVIYFLSHPEVAISSDVSVTQWPLSELGRMSIKQLLLADWIPEILVTYCSDEQKAIDGAEILASQTDLDYM